MKRYRANYNRFGNKIPHYLNKRGIYRGGIRL